MRAKISNEEMRELLNQEQIIFPKYVSPLINFANQYAQGTRPRVVGQMSDLIQEFEGNTAAEWRNWYLAKKPEAIKNATEKIWSTLTLLREVLEKIDKPTVELWVKDFIFVKTFLGLRVQEVLLKKGAQIIGTNYRFSDPSEESKGIDGYIGDVPVSIKPSTYKSKAGLPEYIPVKIIYYKKTKKGLEVDYSELEQS